MFIIECCVRGMSKGRGAYRWERSSGEMGVDHRGGEEGFLGQEMGRRAGEACDEDGPARTHPRKGGRRQHCRVIDSERSEWVEGMMSDEADQVFKAISSNNNELLFFMIL